MTETEPIKTEFAGEILKCLQHENPEISLSSRPRWLKDARWRPELFLKIAGDRRVLAVDIVASSVLPRKQYRQEVKKLLTEHRNLRVAVCALHDAFEKNRDIEDFCKELRIGLKALQPGVGLETIVRTDLDASVVKRQLPSEEGWFPKAILDQAGGLTRIVFAREIDSFVRSVATVGDDEQQARQLSLGTIDKLLTQHPSFRGDFGQFMRLDKFERLLRIAGIESSDHVFHSLRVFLAGCPVIERFYDAFEKAHARYCIGNSRMCVEYSWLLTAIFHDVGRPAEGARDLVLDQLEDEYVEVRGKPERWKQDKYRDALRILGSLAGFVSENPEDASWDGGLLNDDYSRKVYIDWIDIFDEFRYHGVMSAVEFLADIVEKARAADQMRYRPFVWTHAVPAALAILLHDWRVWKSHGRKWRLYPINQKLLPLAALLIYLDTWDDYKRKPDGPDIHVDAYNVNARGAHVVVKWGDSEQLEKEEIKYREFRRALHNRTFGLTIDAQMISRA